MELSITKDEMRACYDEDMPRFLNAIVRHAQNYCVHEGIYIALNGVYDDQDDPYELADLTVSLMHGPSIDLCEMYTVTDGVSFNEIYAMFEDLGRVDFLERAIAYEWLVPLHNTGA